MWSEQKLKMLFVLILIIFSFIFLLSIFGNINERELEKDKKQWEKITKGRYQ